MPRSSTVYVQQRVCFRMLHTWVHTIHNVCISHDSLARCRKFANLNLFKPATTVGRRQSKQLVVVRHKKSMIKYGADTTRANPSLRARA